MIRHYRYRLLQTSWGIAIDLDVDKQEIATYYSFGPRVHKLPNNVYLQICPHWLSNSQKDYLIKGLRLVTDKLKVSASILIRIHRLDYNLCDYQDEGLAAAMANWAAEEFGVEQPKIEAKFTRPENRYVFTFPEG